MLIYKKPKTIDEHKDNIKSLRKIIRNTTKEIPDHEHSAHVAWIFHSKIQPGYEKMGYTANKEEFSKHYKDMEKHHKDQAASKTALKEKAQNSLAIHETALKHLQKAAPKTKSVTRKVARPMITHMPAATASVHLIKDSNYYKRVGRLLHLSIDKSCQEHLKSMTGKSAAELSHEYEKAYKAHPFYEKMQKNFNRAAKRESNERHTTSLASLDIDQTGNLMYSMYNDTVNDLDTRGIQEHHAEFDKMLRLGIRKHPQFNDFAKIAINNGV
jgi:hypothetical protein